MAEFAWRAAQADGRLAEGRSEAASADAVMRQLRERGLSISPRRSTPSAT